MLSANDVKYLASLKQKKYRTEHKQFLIEGFHLVEECLSSSFHLDTIILRSGTDLQNYPAITDKISKSKVKVESLPESSFNKISETEAPQGIIAVVDMPQAHALDYGSPVVALERINDPGNLGTIIRTAYWFGAGSVIISPDSADVYNSKVIRASQGAVFHTGIFEDTPLPEKLKELSIQGYKIYLFTLDAGTTLASLTKPDKSVIVLGNEASGLSEEILTLGFEKVKIEGYSDSESLNVAVTGGIALYAVRNMIK